jgi:hypothetical protein
MAEISEAAVEGRARQLAEQEGYSWQLEYQPIALGTPSYPQRYLSPERRHQFLETARAQLQKEAGKA